MELALIAEGTSDKVLIQPIRWLCNDINPNETYEIEPIVFDNVSRKPNLTEKIRIVLRQNQHQIILVHRDQDKMERADRSIEIENAVKTASIEINPSPVPHCIPVIPVRMTEAWLLIDEPAIKQVAGFPKNKATLGLPRPSQLESTANPKVLLYETIKFASGKTGRKLKNVRPQQMMHTLADIIDDYSPLDHLPAFQLLRNDLTSAITA